MLASLTLAKTASTGTFCSNRPRAKSTLAATSPPFTWISQMWAFFCLSFTRPTCRGWSAVEEQLHRWHRRHNFRCYQSRQSSVWPPPYQIRLECVQSMPLFVPIFVRQVPTYVTGKQRATGQHSSHRHTSNFPKNGLLVQPYAYLGVGDDAHDLGVLLDAVELGLDLLRRLGELLGVPGERLFLRRVPVLVEPSSQSKSSQTKPRAGQTKRARTEGRTAAWRGQMGQRWV